MRAAATSTLHVSPPKVLTKAGASASGSSEKSSTMHSPSASRSGMEVLECATTGIAGGGAQLLFNPQQLVVFGDPLAARRGAGLDLAGVQGYDQVTDRGIFRLAGTVGHHGGPARPLRQFDRLDGLGQGADLVQLDQHGIGRTL